MSALSRRVFGVLGAALLTGLGFGQYTYTTVNDFVADGSGPNAPTFDSKGDAFGTCDRGGARDCGTIWELSAAGTYQTLHSFNLSADDGAIPYGGVAIDSKGDLFGTCLVNGAYLVGTVWELSASGIYRTLHSFGASATDGRSPWGAVTIDAYDNLFGTCPYGGVHGDGTVWEISAAGNYKTLHSFGATIADGQSPFGGASVDAKGDLFGTCSGSGDSSGTVWEISAAGTYTTLYSFGVTAWDGRGPFGAVSIDAKGDLFGTCSGGGYYGKGIVWEVPADGSETILYSFGIDSGDGIDPQAGVTIGPNGALYGTCTAGGAFHLGTVWSISAGYCRTLYSFGSSTADGSGPTGVSLDAKGDVYGTCVGGARFGGGTFWEIAETGGYRTQYAFGSAAAEGDDPLTGVTCDSKGNTFGTCSGGGANGEGGVWEIPVTGGYRLLYSFGSTGTDGTNPLAGVTIDAKGDIFGTCNQGGSNRAGTVWEITAAGTYKTLYSFNPAEGDGQNPYGGVTVDAKGDLFGTCYGGGTEYMGTVWEIPANGAEKIIHSFGYDPDGGNPYSGVTMDSKGDLFGTCYVEGAHNQGTVWEISATGTYRTLYAFGASPGDGDYPRAGVMVDSKGNLYGTCTNGGDDRGTVWEISASGAYRTLHAFGTVASDGEIPSAGVSIDANGNLFGTCPAGGANNCGTVWELTSNGVYATLHSFGATAADGIYPSAGVTIDLKGNLYGPCQYIGADGGRTIWELTVSPSQGSWAVGQ